MAIRIRPAEATFKDEEVGKIVVQWTQELEQKHKEALEAHALAHGNKVREQER